jgi:hypothetical protein
MATHSEQRELALHNLKQKVGGISLRHLRQNPKTTLLQWENLCIIPWEGVDEVEGLLKEVDLMTAQTDLQDTLIEWLGGADVMEDAEYFHLRNMSDGDALQALYIFVLLTAIGLYR